MKNPSASIIVVLFAYRYISPVANDTSEIFQPCVSVIGKIKICGALPMEEVAKVNRNTIAAMTHE